MHQDKKGEPRGKGIYEIITVGRGLGGSSLAKAMAERGARVLVLERETQFKDRGRGENLVSWGGWRKRRRWASTTSCAPPAPTSHPSLVLCRTAGGRTTRPHRHDAPKTPVFTFYHPAMQEVLLQAAADAGAEVRRGASVRDVKPGGVPVVVVEQGGGRGNLSTAGRGG